METLKNTRVVRSPRGPEKTAKTWAAEAAMRMMRMLGAAVIENLPIEAVIVMSRHNAVQGAV